MNPETSNLEVSYKVKYDLYHASKWAKFLAIVGFVFTGLILLGALFMLTFNFSSFPEMGGQALFATIGFKTLGVVYLIIGGVHFLLCYYLYAFARKSITGVNTDNQVSFEQGIENLRKTFKALGIITACFIALYALIIIIAIFSAVIGAML